MIMNLSKFAIVLVELGKGVGSEQSGLRPMVIVSNNVGNRFSPTVMVAACTTKSNKRGLPTHVDCIATEGGFERDTTVCLEMKMTIDKTRIIKICGLITSDEIKKDIEMASLIAEGIDIDSCSRYIAWNGEKIMKSKAMREEKLKTS